MGKNILKVPAIWIFECFESDPRIELWQIIKKKINIYRSIICGGNGDDDTSRLPFDEINSELLTGKPILIQLPIIYIINIENIRKIPTCDILILFDIRFRCRILLLIMLTIEYRALSYASARRNVWQNSICTNTLDDNKSERWSWARVRVYSIFIVLLHTIFVVLSHRWEKYNNVYYFCTLVKAL